MDHININGKLLPAAEAGVPFDNRAFRYGYGLFETMLCWDGVVQMQAQHWTRLYNGMVQLRFDVPKLMNEVWMEEEVLRTVKKNKQEGMCRVRMQVYAGGGGMFDATSMRPEFIIECFPLTEEMIALNEHGLQVGIAEGSKKSMDSLANIKSCSALIYAMAAKQAKEQKWNDALICNTEGHIIESAIANIFWIKDGQIYTPPLADGCVAGVMRGHIIDTLREKGKTVITASLSEQVLYDADELFLTNAIRRIKWVEKVHDKTYGNKQVQSIYHTIFG